MREERREGRREEGRELAALIALAVVFAVACVFLGRWQYHRFQSKYDADHEVGRNYRAAPVALATMLPEGATTLPHQDRWRPVRVTGSYDAARQVLVRNRPLDGTYGYEVLVPLQPVEGGAALLVDRGWVPNGRTGQAPDAVPAPPSGAVTVTAHLLPTEAPKSGSLPSGQFASVDIARIAERSSIALRPAYGVLTAESPRPADSPSLLAEPDDGGYWGVNLSYAVQWVLFGLAGLAFPFVFVRRRRRLRVEDAVAPARRRRTRIWDEEDD